MPLWAARYTPLVTADARLERLQDISEEDGFAEGVGTLWGSSRLAYAQLWDSLHTKPGTDWKASPMVVVLEFAGVKG